MGLMRKRCKICRGLYHLHKVEVYRTGWICKECKRELTWEKRRAKQEKKRK